VTVRPPRRVLIPERLREHLEGWLQDMPGLEDRLEVLPRRGWAAVRAGEVTGAVLWSWTPGTLAREVLERCPRLRWMHSTWTGLEHLPLRSIRERRITLTTAGRVVARPLAEWVAAAILWRLKELRSLERHQRAHRWNPVRNRDLEGLRVLLLGLGTIGREVARILGGFRAVVTGVRASARPGAVVERVLPPDRLAEAAAGTEVLVVTVPLTPATRGLVDRRVLAALPDGSGIVNIARGQVVDESALLEELTAGRLWAALDVFPVEPLPPGSPLWNLENVLISPHTAHGSPRHREGHLRWIRELIPRHLEARRLPGVVPGARLEQYLSG